MTPQDHILAIVEPTDGGDLTVDLAEATIARGGKATVVVLITDRVLSDIRAFATAEDLAWNDAHAQALEQIEMQYVSRTGAATMFVRSQAKLFDQLRSLVTEDVTAIALPEQLVENFSVQAFANSIGVPVTVTPSSPANRRGDLDQDAVRVSGVGHGLAPRLVGRFGQ